MSELYLLKKNPNDPGSYESTICVDFDSHEDFGVISLSVPLSTLKRLVKSKTRFLKIESTEIGALLRSIVAAYKALLAHLQSISGVQVEQGRKTKIAVDDGGTSIIVM